MAKQTKTLADVQTVTTVSDDQLIPITDASGNVVKVSLANLKAALLDGISLSSINSGIFIMTHRKSDNYPLMYCCDQWTAQQAAGEIADGVAVVEGGKILIVAPTEATEKLLWSSAAVSGGETTTTDRITALNDWNGQANTAAQAAKTQCSGESYAPGFCAAYSRVNANGQGLTAGQWWLPSLGEMMMIFANMQKINYALSLIEGATQLQATAYWASTEYSELNAWYLNLNLGGANFGTKATYKYLVRAVSAFLR